MLGFLATVSPVILSVFPLQNSRPTSSLLKTWYYFCAFALLGLASCLVIGLGPYKPFSYALQISGLGALLLLLANSQRPRLDTPVLLTLAMVLLLCVCQKFSPEEEFPKRAMKNIIAWGFFCIATYQLPSRAQQRNLLPLGLAIALLVTLSTFAQAVAIFALDKTYGFFHNPHFLALQNIAACCISLYFASQHRNWQRYLHLSTLIAALVMLWHMSSGAAWASLLITSIAILILCFGHIKKLRPLFAALVILATIGVLSFEYNSNANYQFDINSMITLKDERPTLWLDALDMQLDASPMAWFFGHGIGSFENAFKAYNSFNTDFVFPHNFFLEVLYTSGLTGLVAFCTLAVYIFRALIRLYKRQNSHLALLALALLLAIGAHIFLTLPLFSRYGSYCLALALGFSFWTVKDGHR